MNLRYAIFEQATLGPNLDYRQSGEVIGVTAQNLNLNRMGRGNIAVSGDVHYFEAVVYATAQPGEQDVMEAVVGIVTDDASNALPVGGDAFGIGYDLAVGQIKSNGVTLASVDEAVLGDVIGVRLDLEARDATFFLNGIQQAVIDVSGWVGVEWRIGASLGSQAYGDLELFINTGQRMFEVVDPLAPLGWYEAPVQIDTIYLGTHDHITFPEDEPANQRIEGCVPLGNSKFTITRSVSWWTDGSESVTRPAVASLEIIDATGQFDELISGDVRDLAVPVYQMDSDGLLLDAETIATLIIDRVDAVDDMSKRLVLKDGAAKLDNPLQRRLFLPSVDRSAANRPVPISLGSPLGIAPTFVGEFERDFGLGPVTVRRYQIHDAPLLGYGYFRDKGDILEGSGTPDPVYYASPDGQGVDLLVNPAGKLTIDVSSVGGDVPVPPSSLVPTALLDWDASSSVTVSAGVYTFHDSYTADEVRAEAWLRMDSVLQPMTTYSYTLEITEMTGFFGGTGQRTRVQFLRDIGAPNFPQLQLKSFSAPGYYAGSFLNNSAGVTDFIVAMVGTQSSQDEAKLKVAMTLYEVSTIPVTSDNLVPITLREFLREIMIVRGGFSESEVDLDAAAAIDVASGALGIGWHTTEQVTVRQALEDVLPSFGVCLAQNRNGVFVPIRIVAPEDQTPQGVIERGDLFSDLGIALYEPRGLTNQFGLQRNETVLDPTDFVDDFDPVDGVDLPTRVKLSQQYREVVSTGSSFASAYSFAYANEPLGTRYFRIADAQRELDRIRAIFVTQRRLHSAAVPLDAPYDLGQFWELRYPRYGLDAGKVLMVVGIVEDRINNRATLTLWG